jgi:hypothetical protein
VGSRLFVGSTGHIGITPPRPLRTLALTALVVGQTPIGLGQPSNPSGDGVTWSFDPQSASLPADLEGTPIRLDWVETATDGQIITVSEWVIVERGLVAGNPRYTTLGGLKAYGRAGDLPGSTRQLQDDDPTALQAIARAEEAIDCYCGTSFSYEPGRSEVTVSAFADKQGWLKVRTFLPVAAVSNVEIMDLLTPAVDFQPLPARMILVDDTVSKGFSPLLRSYRFRVLPTSPLPAAPRGRYLVRVTYDGGYSTIPTVIEGLCNRIAWWYWKIRDVPMGTVRDLQNATITIPQDFPPDALGQMSGWRNLPL